MNSKEVLNKYVCKHPFEYIDIQTDADYVCCPSWCPTNIRAGEDLDWNSSNAKDIRKSVVDGSYRHCKHEICPSLSSLLNTGLKPYNFYTKEEFEKKYDIKTVEDVDKFEKGPEEVLFGWDRSCNLKCPSCRINLIPNSKINSKEHKAKVDLLEVVENKLGPTLKKIVVTGSGDPFYSNIYRDFLLNFDKSKYPSLENIQIITNGKMLDKSLWDKLKAGPYIKQIEISIDAGTKETYENVTRLGGKWDKLLQNLEFISTIPTLSEVIISMVVSEKNYKEMDTFHTLISSIFKNSTFTLSINFRQHIHWGTGKYTEQEVYQMQVFNKEHKDFLPFMQELLKVNNKQYVNHNFHHLL
jgi:wyosine [tRNA(Phe)-imidazoG37] synthetase (radical SAM superfamily)